jgi:hypothetical protein
MMRTFVFVVAAFLPSVAFCQSVGETYSRSAAYQAQQRASDSAGNALQCRLKAEQWRDLAVPPFRAIGDLIMSEGDQLVDDGDNERSMGGPACASGEAFWALEMYSDAVPPFNEATLDYVAAEVDYDCAAAKYVEAARVYRSVALFLMAVGMETDEVGVILPACAW